MRPNHFRPSPKSHLYFMVCELKSKEMKVNIMMFLLTFLITIKSSVTLTNKTQMIVEVMKSLKGSAVAKVCWDMSDKMDFAMKLKSTEYARTFQLINNINTIEKDIGEDLLVILDLSCPDRQMQLQEANENNMFEPPFKWLILIEEENRTREPLFPMELENLNILVNSEVIVAHKIDNDEVLLQMIYKIDGKSDIITEMYGIWTGKRLHLSEDIKMTIAVRRKDLARKAIAMSVIVTHESTKTEIHTFNYSTIVTDVYARGSFYSIAPLYDYMNASLQLVFTDTWGYRINNSWNGMVGQLQRGEADLCGTMIFMSSERNEVLNYMTMSFEMRASFVFLAPPLSLQNNLFILPFKTTLWASIGALIVVLMVVVYVNASWERAKGLTKEDDSTTLQPSVSDVAMCITGAITQQGCNAQLKGSLGRTVTFMTLFSFVFIYTSYSASIVALLQSTSDQIRTLTDLLNSKLEVGVEDQPYNRHYFARATDRVRKAIYETKVARTGYKPNFMHIQEGVKKMKNSETPFAFHMDIGLGYRIVNQYFLEHEKCGLREIPYIPKGRTWFCCRKKSPYREIYKLGLSRIIEHGLSQRVRHQLMAPKPRCVTSGGSVASVNMMDFKPVILCWLYGVIASVLVLSMEILVHWRKGRLEFGNL